MPIKNKSTRDRGGAIALIQVRYLRIGLLRVANEDGCL